MANYIPRWRSNYFSVKDVDAFTAWAKNCEADVAKKHDQDPHSPVCLIQNQDSEHGIPLYRYNEVTADYEDFDFFGELALHLQSDQTAVVQEIGYEKYRYFVGYSVAVNAQGHQLKININDIYKNIQKKWHQTASPVEY